jgi:hypothetical protein
MSAAGTPIASAIFNASEGVPVRGIRPQPDISKVNAKKKRVRTANSSQVFGGFFRELRAFYVQGFSAGHNAIAIAKHPAVHVARGILSCVIAL